MIGIVCSRADEASEHIVERLREIADWTERVDDSRADADGGGTYYTTDDAELRYFDDLHLSLDGVADAFGDIDWLVFASRHSGDTGPLLTAHVTGNFGDAEYGGTPGELAEAAPAALSAVVDGLVQYAPERYDVGIECTHHGPSAVGVPSMFVELGSGPDEWADEAGATAVANAILAASTAPAHAPRENGIRRHIVGFGGGHYAPRFTRIVRDTDWHVGHVAANWCLDDLGDPTANEAVIERAFEQSTASIAVLDGNQPEVAEAVEALGYQVKGETWLRETQGVDLGIVETLERDLCSIDDGLRFGEQVSAFTGTPQLYPLPSAVIEEARRVDADAVRAAVEARALAFETEESGTRLGEEGAFAGQADREALIDDLADVLDREYDVERTAEAVVVHESAFSPERAATLGVPEGPKFGRLSNGQPVEVDGERIAPDDVTVERTRRLSTAE